MAKKTAVLATARLIRSSWARFGVTGPSAREDFRWWYREVRKVAGGRYHPDHVRANLLHITAALELA